MKKTDIKEGVTYQNRSGKAARRVIAIVYDRSTLPGPSYWYETQSGPWVRYMQERGPDKGNEDVSLLSTFASWAHSEDTGAPESVAELRETVITLRTELESAWVLIDARATDADSTALRHHATRIKSVLLDAGSNPRLFDPCPVRGGNA